MQISQCYIQTLGQLKK